MVTADVPFAAFVAASASQPLWAQGVGLVLWSLLSQFPLIFFVIALIALIAGKEALFSKALAFVRERFGAALRYVLPVLCCAVLCVALGGAFLLDVILFPATRFALLPFLHV